MICSIYFGDVEIECSRDNSLVDIYAGGSLVELKTPNTNYRVDNVGTKTRPITNNIDSIIKDIQNVTEEVNNHLLALVAKLINLNINQLENKIDKKQAEKELEDLIKDHFALEEICFDIRKYKKEMIDSVEKQK